MKTALASISGAESKGTYRRAPLEKRERLLAAARELFLSQGFEATSTQQIARQAGVSEGILFHHFGSKAELFHCIARAFAQDSIGAVMQPRDGTLSEETVVRSAFDFADANPGMFQLLTQVSDRNSPAETAERSAILIDAIRQGLELGMAAGQVRQGDAEIMAQLQFAIVDAAYRGWARTGDSARREDFIREAVLSLQAITRPLPETCEPASPTLFPTRAEHGARSNNE